jgi:hypothetical protein
MRLREPAAWVALGALVINLGLVVVALATINGSLVSVGWVVSARVANPIPLLVLTILVTFCVLRERTPHARQLTIISLIAAVIAVLLGLGLVLLGFGAAAPILAVLAALVPQAISIIAVGLLIKLLQLQAVPRRLPAGIGLVPHPSDVAPAPPVPDPQLQPTWQPDAAAGAAWRTAGDAAAGAPATGWGTAAPSVGWQPIPTQPMPGQAMPMQPMPGQPMPRQPMPPQPMPPQAMPQQAMPPQAMPQQAMPQQSNGPRPQGRIPDDPTIRSPLPVPEHQQPNPPRDPWADQGQRNSQPPALDWWGRPQS